MQPADGEPGNTHAACRRFSCRERCRALYGSRGNDVLQGGNGNDEIYGGVGVDLLFGNAGNDYLEGGDDTDLLVGGPGADRINALDGFFDFIIADEDDEVEKDPFDLVL